MSTSDDSPDRRNSDGNARNANWGRELHSRMINVEEKRIFMDLKENNAGRVLKISEIVIGGRKTRILVAMEMLPTLITKLKDCSIFADALKNDTVGKSQIAPGLWKSEILSDDTRQYYLDVKENARGVFFRLSQVVRVARRSDMRQQIIIPASGLRQFFENLEIILDDYGQSIPRTPIVAEKPSLNVADLPKAKSVRAGPTKIFFFDSSANSRGAYLRMTELNTTSGSRSSIAVPMDSFHKFKAALDEIYGELHSEDTANTKSD